MLLELAAADPSQPVTGVRMRRIATGLLIVMGVLFVASDSFDERWPALSFLKAFSEAAMIGGLADWFAVTALFRHPMGIPIPHTAIIPRNKDRIATTLAQFLRTNFLTPVIVARRLERFDIASGIGRWMMQPEGLGRMRKALGDLAAQIFDAIDNEAIGGMLRSAAIGRLRSFEVAPVLGRAIDGALEDSRHEMLLQSALRWADRALGANEALLREVVRQRTNWMLRLATVDEAITQNIIYNLKRLFEEIAADPRHPLRGRLILLLRELAADLQENTPTRVRVERVKNEVIDHPEVARTLESLWASTREAVLRVLREPENATAARLDAMLNDFGRTLLADEALRDAINSQVRRLIVTIVANYGDELVSLVSDTIRGWDAATIVERLEGAVSRDLQYIRLNGTLIGGLAGLTIYAVTRLI